MARPTQAGNSSQRALVAVLFAGALMHGCGGNGESAAPAASVPPAGQWYAGDFHVHSSVGSNDTRYPDGSARSFPETIRDAAIALGMSFVVVTDHSNSTGSIVESQVEDAALWNQGPEFPLWDTAAQLSSADFLMINGNEISPVSTLEERLCPECPTLGTGSLTPVGHVGCVPVSLNDFDRSGAFIDRPPGALTGGSSVEQCQARAGFAIVNHPLYRATPWIEYDWTNYSYDAIEVWNGSISWSTYDIFAYDAYLCDRLAGRDVVAVGGSDNHRTPLPYEDEVSVALGAPLGLPLTSVFAPRLDWDTIMEAARNGRIVIHERGTFVDLQVLGSAGYAGGIGDRIRVPPEAAVTVRLRGQSPRAQALALYHVAPGACTERRQPGRDNPPVVEKTVVFSQTVCAAGSCTFGHEPTLSLVPGLYFATVGDFNVRGVNIRDVAVTNVFTVDVPHD